MTIRLMVVDGHEPSRARLAHYFEMLPGFEVAAEAANTEELVKKLETTPVDILLLDLDTPGLTNVAWLTVIKSRYPDLPVLILSAHIETQRALSVLKAGASGFISKNCSPQALLDAVREVMETGKYLTRDMAVTLACEVSRNSSSPPPETAGARQGSEAMTLRLIITDDHELFRDGLVRYLKKQPDIEVVAEAANGDELLHKLRTLSADLLLLDINMPGLSGGELISAIKSLYPDLPVLVLSAHDDVRMVLSAMRAGASGFICKTCASLTLLEAIREVVATGKYLTQDMAEMLLYASVRQPYEDEIKGSDGVTRLNGKSIKEWREDCLTFYQEKANQENINIALDSKNKAVENENFDLSEKVRHFEQQNQGNEFD